jgi:hypothetical protein
VLIRDRGGAHSLEAMRAALRARPAGGLAVDGPLGPYHRVKPGVVTLASELDMLVFPIAIAARPQRRSAGRWDRMLFPLPFARVALVVGEALAVPPDLTTTEAAAWRQRVHDALEDAGRRARTLIGDAESGNAVADGRVPGILPPG